MQKVLLFDQIEELRPVMLPEAFHYLAMNRIESFEAFETFSLLAFDWYDLYSSRTKLAKILIYMDRENLFFICGDDAARKHCCEITDTIRSDAPANNEQMLYRFFLHLFRGDMAYLDEFEAQTNDRLTALLSGKMEQIPQEVSMRRRELLRLKHYYEQIDLIFDEMSVNDNRILSANAIRSITILGARTDRYLNKVSNLQELVSQMQETYQSQLSIQQNNLMKIFTVVTVIFLPLTLLAGWYGMNFAYMPELHWRYGYPAVIAVSIIIVFALIGYFKHKKWL